MTAISTASFGLQATPKKEDTNRRLPICTLGAPGHGKITLTAAMAKVVARIGAIHTKADSNFGAQIPTSPPIREDNRKTDKAYTILV